MYNEKMEILQCQHCDYTTVRSGDLKVHSRKHIDASSGILKTDSFKHNGEMLQCQYCDYTTTKSGNMKRHYHKHADEIKLNASI